MRPRSRNNTAGRSNRPRRQPPTCRNWHPPTRPEFHKIGDRSRSPPRSGRECRSCSGIPPTSSPQVGRRRVTPSWRISQLILRLICGRERSRLYQGLRCGAVPVRSIVEIGLLASAIAPHSIQKFAPGPYPNAGKDNKQCNNRRDVHGESLLRPDARPIPYPFEFLLIFAFEICDGLFQ